MIYIIVDTSRSGIIRVNYLRYIGEMIEIKIQEIAQNAGITNAYQFQKQSGFSVSMAARIFKGKWKRMDIKTLNTICNVLNCAPNDILEFTPDIEEQ